MTFIVNRLKSVDNFGDTLLMNELEANMKTWLDWSFLKIGAYRNVEIPTPGAFGGDFSILRRVDDPSFAAGRVWEGVRKDWVWEGNIVYTDPDTLDEADPPINPVSTVLVNGSPAAVNYYVNYPLGRIVFDTAISTSATVKAEYSYRYVQIYRADDADWWQELQYHSFRPDDNFFTQLSTGNWAVGSQHRIQLPCVVLESVPRSIRKPYQLGDGSYWVEQDIVFHILAETRSMRNRLTDILSNQFDNTIQLYSSDQVALAESFPLDFRGDIIDNTQTFDVLSTNFGWKTCRFKRTEVSEVETINPKLFEGTVRMTCEVVLDD